MSIRQLVNQVKEHEFFRRFFKVVAPVPWDASAMESRLDVRVPTELSELWGVASSMRLFETAERGLMIASPDEALVRTQAERWMSPDDIQQGDLLVGEFQGEAQKVIVRCDPSQEDYGHVLIVETPSSRMRAAPDLHSFLERYVEAQGDKYWQAEAAYQ